MLLGGEAGHRLEPVREVRRAVLDRPFLQRAGDDVRAGGVERLTLGDRAPKRTICITRQPCALRFVVEGEGTEVFSRPAARRRDAGAGRCTPVTDAANRVAC